MLSLTALLHTSNDGLRLGRCLETAYACNEIVIIDHGSTDDTLHVAHEFGAKIVHADPEMGEAHRIGPVGFSSTHWVLCLDPRESLSEALAASLLEWKWNAADSRDPGAHAILLREENAHGWIENPIPQTRLVPANWDRWSGRFPVNDRSSVTLEGKLLRFAFP
jgi:glycosyltransferase involved in cell wall biosynthesis